MLANRLHHTCTISDHKLRNQIIRFRISYKPHLSLFKNLSSITFFNHKMSEMIKFYTFTAKYCSTYRREIISITYINIKSTSCSWSTCTNVKAIRQKTLSNLGKSISRKTSKNYAAWIGTHNLQKTLFVTSRNMIGLLK